MKEKSPYYLMIIIIICLIFAYVIFFIITMDSSNDAEVIFHTDHESFSFSCKMAETLEEKYQGLRDVSSLPKENGMIFVYDSMQPLVFTMTNMSIPLDIIFIDDKYMITHIVKANIGEAHIHSNSPAQYVVEINQGLTEEYMITI